MNTDTVLQATARERVGKNASRALRASGQVPVSIYGGGKEPLAVAISSRELSAMLRKEAGRNTIFSIDMAGQDPTPVMIKRLDLHPVTGRALHADLVRIDLANKTRVSVPLHFEGEPEGVKVGGGLFEVHTHTLDILCLPKNIPDSLNVDVTKLTIGQHLRAGDIEINLDEAELGVDPDFLIASVTGKGGPAETETE